MKFLVLMLALAAAQDDFRENVIDNRGIDTYGAPAAPSLDAFSNQPQPTVDVQTGPWETVPTQGFSTVPVGNNYQQPGHSTINVYSEHPAAPALDTNVPAPVWDYQNGHYYQQPAYDTRHIPQPYAPNKVASPSLFNSNNLFIASMAALSIWVMIAVVSRVVLPLLKLSWATQSIADLFEKFLPSKEEVVAKGRSLAEVNSVARTVFEAIDKYNLLNE
jgi:hypothetical protein